METQANYVAAGAFVVGLMISLVFFVLWISSVHFGAEAPLYDIYFEGSVSGLRVNEDVSYHGIPIGKVRGIGVDPKSINRVRVRVSITEPRLMRKDIIASIEAQGLTGYTYIQIQGGRASSPLLKVEGGNPYPVIPSQPSGIDVVFSNAPHLISSLYRLSEQLNDVFDARNREEFRSFMTHISRISRSLSEGNNSLESLMRHTQNTLDQINRSASIMETGFDSFAQTMANLQGFLHHNKENASEVFDELPKALRQVTLAASQLRRLSHDLERENPLGVFSKSEKPGYKLP